MRRLPVVGLAFALTSAAAWAAPAVHDLIARDGVEVGILPAIAPDTPAGTVVGVALDVEARTDAAARRLGFRSLHAIARVDCRARASQVVEAETFDQPNLTGAGRAQTVSKAWVHPAAGSYMSTVADRVCASAGEPQGPAPAIKVTLDSAPAPARPTPPSPTPAANAPVPPAATPPLPPPALGLEAQVAASRTAADARKALASLGTLIAPPLAASVQPALVGGKRFYRASIGGFASLASARAFCVQAIRVIGRCWVRQGAASPRKPATPAH